MKAALLMILYAAGLAFAGVIAFGLAPEGATKFTALLVPALAGGVMVVCAVLSLRIKSNYKQGMVGIHIGLILPIIFAVLFGMRAMKSDTASKQYREHQRAHAEQLADPTTDTPTDFREFLQRQAYSDAIEQGTINPSETPFEQFQTSRAGGVVDHDKAYLAATLWNLAVWSCFAFVALLMQRPTPDKRGATQKSDAAPREDSAES